MTKLKDLTAKKIGRFTVVKRHFEKKEKIKKYKTKYHPVKWLLKCNCGERFIRSAADINRGLVYECPNCTFRRSKYYIGGKKFGRLSVQDRCRIEKNKNNHFYRVWLCICECGIKKWIRARSIISGSTKSCGCFSMKNNSRYANETLYPMRHGKSQDSLYQPWISLIHKCYNSKNQSYNRFGAKGYTVCDIWRNSFEAFHDWMKKQKWKKGLTIHIKTNEKEFNPKTSILISTKKAYELGKQESNLRKYGITYKGKVLILSEWAKEFNMSYQCLYGRIKNGLTFEEAINKEYNQGSGTFIARKDISNDMVKDMYEKGMTHKEIEEKLNFNPAYRLKKMGVKKRPAIRRHSCLAVKIIKKMTKKKASFDEIYKKTGYENKHTLKYRMQIMGFKFNKMKIIYKQ